MPTASKTQNNLVEKYYDVMREFSHSEIVETKKGTMFIMDENKLKETIVGLMLHSYHLGELKHLNKEGESDFDIKSYLIRK